MDPLAIQGAANSGWTRPTQSSAVDLSAVLRQGRVFAGDVLQTLGGGTVLLGVGPLRVPARAQAELKPGRRYLFEVVHSGSPLELRLVAEGAAAQPELLRALRSFLGAEAPLGTLLEELSHALRDAAERAPGGTRSTPAHEALGRWAQELEEHAWRPEDDASGLRSKLARSGLGFEARMAQAVLESAPPAELERIGAELVAALTEQLRAGGASGAVDGEPAALLTRLAHALAQALGSDGGDRLGADLARPLAAALGSLAAPEAHALLTALSALDWPHWPAWMRALTVRTLLRSLLGATARREQDALAPLHTDLKAQLLAAEAQLGEGALRAAVERALVGIEADQLLNLARATVDESAQWSVPLSDAGHFSTLHLRVVRDGRRSASGESDSPARRVALEVEFSRTGAVHVDLLQGEGAVTARVLALDQAVIELLSKRVGELEQALAAGGATVRARVVRARDAAELHAQWPPASSYFAAQHLMDVEG